MIRRMSFCIHVDIRVIAIDNHEVMMDNKDNLFFDKIADYD